MARPAAGGGRCSYSELPAPEREPVHRHRPCISGRAIMWPRTNDTRGCEGAVGIMAKASKRKTTVAAPEGSRYEELKRMLQERQRELVAEVQGKIRGVRADGAE